jgi:hypothetical protein
MGSFRRIYVQHGMSRHLPMVAAFQNFVDGLNAAPTACRRILDPAKRGPRDRTSPEVLRRSVQAKLTASPAMNDPRLRLRPAAMRMAVSYPK